MEYKVVDCPACHGMGEYQAEVITDDGKGPMERCGYCQGKGRLKKNHFYYQVLGWLSGFKREEKRRRATRFND